MKKQKAGRNTYRFVLLFCSYFGLFYGCSYFVIGAASPDNLYSPLIQNHFDFVGALRTLLLQGASGLLESIGIVNYITGNAIGVPDKIRITVNTACLGIGILSFWWAIVLAYPNSIRLKFKFFLPGSILLIGLNILRIFFLAYVYNIGIGARYSHVDHHLVFNIVVYIVLAIMVVKWMNAAPEMPTKISMPELCDKNDQS